MFQRLVGITMAPITVARALGRSGSAGRAIAPSRRLLSSAPPAGGAKTASMPTTGPASAGGATTAGSAHQAENEFMRERRHIREHAAKSSSLWLKITLFGGIPAILLTGVNAYYLWNAHWEHWDHLPPLEDRVEYPYQNIRNKKYPWGDGDKTLFWNEDVNYHNKDKA